MGSHGVAPPARAHRRRNRRCKVEMHMASDGRRPIARALLIGILLMPCAAGSAANLTPVPAAGDLQAAINAARPGDTIELAPGPTYVGNFTLPWEEGAELLTIP